jgi:tyrosyl-tRNA synthetase
MESYYQLLTEEQLDAARQQIQASPRDAKIRLAKLIITWLHSAEDADAAEAEFKKVFSEGGVPDQMPEVFVGPGPHKIAPLIVKAGLAASNGEATRKIKEGAVSLDGNKVSDFQQTLALSQPVVLKLGRKFARLLP